MLRCWRKQIWNSFTSHYCWSGELEEHFAYALSDEAHRMLRKIKSKYLTRSQVCYDVIHQLHAGQIFLGQLDANSTISCDIRVQQTRLRHYLSQDLPPYQWKEIGVYENRFFLELVGRISDLEDD